MKFTINSSELAKALEQAAKFVSTKPLMPILGNLKLVAVNDTQLFITSFDLSHGIKIECTADVINSGSVCIPASAIAIVKSMSGQLIIEVETTSLITISSLSGQVEIQGQSADEYPEIIDKDFDLNLGHEIDAKSFAQAVKYCTQASSADESKTILTGINITSKDGKMRLMATDGHRLAVCHIDVNESVNIKSVTIPAKSLSLMPINKSEAIVIALNDSQASIDAGSQSIMRTLNGKYPDIMLLIPKSFIRTMEVDRRELIDALNIMLAISDKNNVVKFKIDGHVEISSSSDGKSGKVNISCQLNGNAINLAFNLEYLLDSLKMFDSNQIRISMNEPLQPVIITAVNSNIDLLYLVMPIQLRV